MKSFACKDVGVQCDWKVNGSDDNEIITHVSEHAREKHGFKTIPVEMIKKIKDAIRNVHEDGEEKRDLGAA